MIPSASIWIPVFNTQAGKSVRLIVQNGFTLAEWLGARLNFVVCGGKSALLRSWAAFESRKRESGAFRVTVIEGDVVSETARLARDDGPGVIPGILMLSLDRIGPFGMMQGISPQKARLLEGSSAPVWIMPYALELAEFPVQSILVPMSGESPSSTALELALGLGNRHDVPVDILHVTSSKPLREQDQSALGQFRDQFHHEYPGMIEELISQGSPFSNPSERKVIRDFCHCYGDVSQELKRRIKSHCQSLLIFEWKGALQGGRARKIKLLFRHARGPILLVREEVRTASRLSLGGRLGQLRA